MSVPLGLAIALGLAVALNQAFRGIAWIRTAYFLPVVTSTIAIALVWQWIYSADSGLLNQVTGFFGIPAQKWLSNPTLAMPSIIAMSIWQGLGVNIIIFLAGLQAIPSEVLDAASVDGAAALGPVPADHRAAPDARPSSSPACSASWPRSIIATARLTRPGDLHHEILSQFSISASFGAVT